MKKFYVVLSVKQLRQLANQAAKKQRAAKRDTSHCVVIHAETASEKLTEDGFQQICSHSLRIAY